MESSPCSSKYKTSRVNDHRNPVPQTIKAVIILPALLHLTGMLKSWQLHRWWDEYSLVSYDFLCHVGFSEADAGDLSPSVLSVRGC